MRMSKDPYLIEMVSKEFKSDESGTDKKKKTKDGFQIDSSISLFDWLKSVIDKIENHFKGNSTGCDC